jgi:DNA excision repair protein ERCC-2
LASVSFDQEGKPNLVIDEAHNLPGRAMDSYSPSLSTVVLEKMQDDLKRLPRKFRKEAEKLLKESIAVLRACGPAGCDKPCRIEPPVEMFQTHDAELKAFLSSYLSADVDIQPKDVVLRLSFYWTEFTSALEFVSAGRKEFFTTFHPHPATVKITCCDASEMLKACYNDYAQVVAFSATLKPFEFYERLMGLEGRELRMAEFDSPFSKKRRKILVIPQVSTKYSERERNYPRIAEAIERIIALKRGNYFAFFPSFDFMERVFSKFTPPDGVEVIRQGRTMRRDDIDAVLGRLSTPGSANLVFAVQGGVFSEGVDYPGDMVIGAFVVGPPLPSFDLEQETRRDYYEANYSSGFDYAYTFPAMAKAIQAAGRVIRSETDRGIIVLMDNRFIQSSYAKSMPHDWFKESPRELISDSILRDISAFWKSVESED